MSSIYTMVNVIKNDEDKTDYEDELCDDAKDTKKYPKICKDNSN